MKQVTFCIILGKFYRWRLTPISNYKVNIPPHPITIIIENGQILRTENSTAEFEAVLDMIKEEENIIWVRELGLGLNHAFSKDRFVSDMGTFERMCGLHLSLGAKYDIYAKDRDEKK